MNGFNIKLDITEEKISELGNTVIETIQTKSEGEKWLKKKKRTTPYNLWGAVKEAFKWIFIALNAYEIKEEKFKVKTGERLSALFSSGLRMELVQLVKNYRDFPILPWSIEGSKTSVSAQKKSRYSWIVATDLFFTRGRAEKFFCSNTGNRGLSSRWLISRRAMDNRRKKQKPHCSW